MEVKQSFPIGSRGVCRAKIKTFTPAGDFVTATVAPYSMSSVPLGEEEMPHFCAADKEQ